MLEQETQGSVLICLSGDGLDVFLEGRVGSVQWICQSPFRKNCKRKNWFVGVYSICTPEDTPYLDLKDVRFSVMRARGPGGQHVNKTNSAARAEHGPTGISVTAQEERSQ